ncbi:MAG: TRAP transporter substrate-binding protein, partial [Xenococcus sp. (in: cyanobacteria)]
EKSWKMASFLGAGYENQILYTPPEKVAQLVSDMTNGRFKIEVSYPKKEDYQQGYSTTKLLKDVQDNKIDAAYSGIYYEIEGPSLSLFFSCAIPFGLTPQEQIAWLNYKIIDDKDDVEKKYIQYLLEKYYDNMLIFPVACTGMQMGGWFQKPINEIGDLSGIKMRIPGIGKVILQDDKFGVLSRCQDVDAVGKCKDARIPGHEIKERLKTGQIDAAEWIGPHEDKQLGIHQLPEELNNTWYYYYPGWWEPSTTFSIHVNKNSWEDLGKSRAYKEIFKSACSRVLYETLAEYNEKNGKALADLKAKYQGKIEIRRFSPEILEAVEQATDDYFKEKADKTDGFIDIWTTFNDFKKDIRQWSKIEAYYVDYKDNLE